MIPFTQYLLPDGKKRTVYIMMPDETEDQAQKLIDFGCHFDIEILTTGLVSMTCEMDDATLGIEICTNGPAIDTAITNLVSRSTQSMKELFKKESE